MIGHLCMIAAIPNAERQSLAEAKRGQVDCTPVLGGEPKTFRD